MESIHLETKTFSFEDLGFQAEKIYQQLSPKSLSYHIKEQKRGVQLPNGALSIRTGRFTGRSPKDRYIVDDPFSHNKICWNTTNQPFTPAAFALLYKDMLSYLSDNRNLYSRDCVAGADDQYSIKLRVVTEHPEASYFVYNMFRRLEASELFDFQPQWLVLHAPDFEADPEIHSSRNRNFVIINFTKKIILIGGTGYLGEIKKSVFTVLNTLLPLQHDILPMHCAATEDSQDNVSLFFGLSGTGKTTLSATSTSRLIGDDEHGWTSQNTVFNYEGGCYAKVVNLSEEKEPQIYRAIREGALLENVVMDSDGNVDYSNIQITPNTRASYPLRHVQNAKRSGKGNTVTTIFLLTADAFGLLPPIAKLTREQAIFYFVNGYTAKIPGTETGVTAPIPEFSICFGAPFMSLHPHVYAKLMRKQLIKHKTEVWLVNTGWIGGSSDTGGHRIPLEATRAMVLAVQQRKLHSFGIDSAFGLQVPSTCPGVDSKLLDIRSSWENPDVYDTKAKELRQLFDENYRSTMDSCFHNLN